jgi:heme oxygenase
MNTLREATTGVHHGAEQTPFGERMATGTLTMQEWADWLGAMVLVHLRIDEHLPGCLRRSSELLKDLGATGISENPLISARGIAAALDHGDRELVLGFCYVCSGANLRGGQVIRKVLEPKGFPCSHLYFENFREPNEWFESLRDRTDLAQPAQRAFAAIVGVMGEIDGLRRCNT